MNPKILVEAAVLLVVRLPMAGAHPPAHQVLDMPPPDGRRFATQRERRTRMVLEAPRLLSDWEVLRLTVRDTKPLVTPLALYLRGHP